MLFLTWNRTSPYEETQEHGGIVGQKLCCVRDKEGVRVGVGGMRLVGEGTREGVGEKWTLKRWDVVGKIGG